jgi:hypothetical protein
MLKQSKQIGLPEGSELTVNAAWHDLIDEYRLLTYPALVSKARRLFADGTKPAALRLVESKTTRTGVTINVYEPAGQPAHGSFEASDSGQSPGARAASPSHLPRSGVGARSEQPPARAPDPYLRTVSGHAATRGSPSAF